MKTDRDRPTALVTGSATGIGRATARRLVEAGFTVYATARRPEALGELERLGARTLRLDVTDPESARAAVQAVEAEHGSLGVLVNNAGRGELGPIEEVDPDRWRAGFETNVIGMVRLTQLVLPGMRAAARGRIINIGSAGGEMTFPLAGAYHATKYAVEALSDALRYEVRPFGVEVSLIQPSPVRTPMGDAAVRQTANIGADSPYAPMVRHFVTGAARTYERGTGIIDPDEVARAIVRAATARRPATRYKVGAIAHLMPFVHRHVSDRIWDRMLRSQYGTGVS